MQSNEEIISFVERKCLEGVIVDILDQYSVVKKRWSRLFLGQRWLVKMEKCLWAFCVCLKDLLDQIARNTL